MLQNSANSIDRLSQSIFNAQIDLKENKLATVEKELKDTKAKIKAKEQTITTNTKTH